MPSIEVLYPTALQKIHRGLVKSGLNNERLVDSRNPTIIVLGDYHLSACLLACAKCWETINFPPVISVQVQVKIQFWNADIQDRQTDLHSFYFFLGLCHTEPIWIKWETFIPLTQTQLQTKIILSSSHIGICFEVNLFFFIVSLIFQRLFGFEFIPGLKWNSSIRYIAKDVRKMVDSLLVPESIWFLLPCDKSQNR